MVNLTSFTLCYTLTHEISIGQLLDFLESAPRLRHVELHDAPFISSDQNGRLVSLARLENLIIRAAEPLSLLLDHILVPVGASLETELKSPRPRIEDQLPRSLDNLRNLSNFTRLYLRIDESDSLIKIAGLNGRVRLVSTSPGASIVDFVLESLSRFNTSTVEQLEISRSDPLPEDLLYQALLPMENLHILIISRCGYLDPFICALDTRIGSWNVLACPKLEELVPRVRREDEFDVYGMVGMAAARASRGAKLRSVRVVALGKFTPVDVSELGKHVSQVECCFEDADPTDD